jgi:subtilisin family serine protease
MNFILLVNATATMYTDCYQFWDNRLCIADQLPNSIQAVQGVWESYLDGVGYMAGPTYSTTAATAAIAGPITQIYVIDTWVDISHKDFGGRVIRGPSFSASSSANLDHGTMVVGLIASSRYGRNRNARVESIEVLDSNGYTTWSNLIRALGYLNEKRKPSLINISISGTTNQALELAIRGMIKQGWKIVVASGNDGVDACTRGPGNIPEVLTVGSHEKDYAQSQFSNYGPCVDVLALGSAVASTVRNNRSGISQGTSFSAAIVTGILSLSPDLLLTVK